MAIESAPRLLHANPPRPLLLWSHGTVLSAWIVPFIAQSALVRVRKVTVHRALGWFGAALAATMFVSGFIVSLVMVRFDMTVLHRKTVASFQSVLWCVFMASCKSCKLLSSDFITSVTTTSSIRRSTC